jgi:uroporphyrinogen-III synthase
VADSPLSGKRIVVTRPPHQADELADELGGFGVESLIVPLVHIEAVKDKAALRAALADLSAYDWIVFTSANAVKAVRNLTTGLKAAKVAAVGPATARALRNIGVEPAFVPARFAAEEIVDALEPLAGKRVLLPQADIADPALANELRERGASVTAITAYRTIAIEHSASVLEEVRTADAVVLFSGSAVRSLATQGGVGAALPVYIGPKTAAVGREAGLPEGIVAEEATTDGIIDALTSHFEER